MDSYDWNWSIFAPYSLPLLRGIWVTIQISVLSAILGTFFGFALGILYRLSPWKGPVLLANDILRSIPILVLLFLFYYFPYKQIFGVHPFSEFFTSVLALAFSQAVFTADLVFSSIDRVNSRTVMAAESLGLRTVTIYWHFIIPDIIRQTLPAFVAFWIGLVKLSSFASVIGCQDLVFVASTIGVRQFRTIEVWVLVALVYAILVVPLTLTARVIENSQWIKRR